MRVSRIVGWSEKEIYNYPLIDRVRSEKDMTKFLRWHRFLRHPRTEEEEEIIAIIKEKLEDLWND